MELKEVLLKRRSVRKFADTPVPDEYIEELLHAAMSGPSACNKTPWEFYVVKNNEKLGKVKKASLFSRFNSPLVIVVCGNLSRALPLDLAEYWIQDCSAATENILLRATDLGLGAVWCGAPHIKHSSFIVNLNKFRIFGEFIIAYFLPFFNRPNAKKEPTITADSSFTSIHYIIAVS